MSMLAEPRRRQKIGPNPRGKFFTEDEDNKGRSLLQKMGWKSGDGLGVQRQGIKDPIKPKIQTDEKGLGFDVKSDPWVSHTDDFNELLRNLQAAHGGVVQKAEPPPSSLAPGFGFRSDESNSSKSTNLETGKFDLENKSKASSSRIHYHKFVKNKDLSKIKDKDWNCIFGKSEESATSNRNEIHKAINGQREAVVVSKTWDDVLAQKSFCIDDTPSSSISNVENEHLNRVQRYKAQMMRSFAISTLPEDKPKSHDDEMPAELVTEIDEINTSSKESTKKRKKKNKMYKTEEEEDSTLVSVVPDNNQELSEKKKTKKERKRQKLEESIPKVCEMEIEDEAPNKKKKKKDKRKKMEEEEQPIVEIPEQTEIVSPKKKRKKNKPELAECYDQINSTAAELDIIGVGNQQSGGNHKLSNDNEPFSEISAESVENSVSTDDASSTPTVNFNKRTVSAEEMHAAALVFKGSNILQIPGYRNQSSKLTYD